MSDTKLKAYDVVLSETRYTTYRVMAECGDEATDKAMMGDYEFIDDNETVSKDIDVESVKLVQYED